MLSPSPQLLCFVSEGVEKTNSTSIEAERTTHTSILSHTCGVQKKWVTLESGWSMDGAKGVCSICFFICRGGTSQMGAKMEN